MDAGEMIRVAPDFIGRWNKNKGTLINVASAKQATGTSQFLLIWLHKGFTRPIYREYMSVSGNVLKKN